MKLVGNKTCMVGSASSKGERKTHYKLKEF